jgi:transposase
MSTVQKMKPTQLEARNIIVHNFIENPNMSARKLAKKLNLPQTTVCNVIKKFKADSYVDRKPETGRKPGSHNMQLVSKINRSLKANPGLSDMDRAQRYGTSKSTGRRIRIRAG